MKRSNTAAKRRIVASLLDEARSASSGSFHLFSSGKFNNVVKFFSFSRAAAASSFSFVVNGMEDATDAKRCSKR